MLKRRHFTALAGASGPMVARGQARWKPEKPITIYNPFAAGGVLGQQVIVDIETRPSGAPAGEVGCETQGRMPWR